MTDYEPREDLWPLPPRVERVYLEAPEVALDLLRSALAEGFYLAETLDRGQTSAAGWAVLASWLTFAAQNTPGAGDDLTAAFLARLAHEATEHAGVLLSGYVTAAEASERP